MTATDPASAPESEPAAQNVEPASFGALDADDAQGAAAPDVDLNVILEVNVDLALEVGRTSICVRDLLQLNQGSVVELDRLAGESLDVLVNGTLVARGEVVVVNDNYGVRLTEVVSPTERIRQFK